VWAVAFYYQTFFAAPHLWWWGDDIPRARYALWAGALLVGAVIAKSGHTIERSQKFIGNVGIAFAINATIVHFGWSTVPEISVDNYTELMKYVLLYFLITNAVKNRTDFRIVLMSIALGSAYIGYEVTINERGDFNGSRLEGVGAPAADQANGLASIMLLAIPLSACLFSGGTWVQKATAVGATPLALNVLLLCNSRGAFLGLIGMGATLLALARGATRKNALRTLLVGSVALYALLGDPRILERFATTFVGSEDRDNSAASRMVFWRAGLAMLRDYPLGAGGSAFKEVHAVTYLREVGSVEAARSLHNGFLTDATDWGIQGLFLKLLFMGAALVAAYRTSARCRAEGRNSDSLMGLSLIVSTVGFLITCMFGSFLNNEWAYWLVALMARYAEVYEKAEEAVAAPARQPAMTYGRRPVSPANAAMGAAEG
jgi:O-antigen ligase